MGLWSHVLHSLTVSLIVTCHSACIEEHATQTKVTPSGQKIIVFDSLLPEETTTKLRQYVLQYAHWELSEESAFCSSDSEDIDSTCQKHINLPWTASLSPKLFERWHLATVLAEIRSFAGGSADRIFYPYSIRAEILQRGDNIPPHMVAPSQYTHEYSSRLFLTPDWQMNDYGDMTFYTPSSQNRTSGSNHEILLTVRPQPGRLILWDATIPVLYRPPSVGYIQALLSISVQLTESRAKFDAACTEWEAVTKLKEELAQETFPQLNEPVGDVDPKNHVVRTFVDSKERKVVIFDDLFDKSHLEALRTFLVESPSVGYLPYNIESYELSDNTQWIKTFDPFDFPSSSTWEVLAQVLAYISGDKTDWYPYDVSVNVIRSADHTRIHEDCEEWEDEYTMVLYLNPDFGIGDYGETFFYDAQPFDEYSQKLYSGISQFDYEAIGAVTPKYGRLVVFPGTIPHAARPPSTGYSKARYTFAVKAALNKKVALTKKLQETLEDGDTLTPAEEKLLMDIQRVRGDVDRLGKTEEWLESVFTRTKEKGRQRRTEEKQQLEHLLAQ